MSLCRSRAGRFTSYDQNGFIVSHSNKKMLGKQFIDVDYMQNVYGMDNSNIIQKLEKVMCFPLIWIGKPAGPLWKKVLPGLFWGH